MTALNVAEIFRSIDGEVNHFHQGRQTIFLRLTGCNLAYDGNKPCPYCDTVKYQSLENGSLIGINEICKTLELLGRKNLTITGGEPLWQMEQVKELLKNLNNSDIKNVSIETNGSINIPKWIFSGLNVSFVIDCKLTDPQYNLMKRSNFENASAVDWCKMIITSDQCMDRAIEVYHIIRSVNKHVNIAFSPVFDSSKQYDWYAKNIIKRLEKEGIYDAVLNIQLHKIIDVK